MSDASGPALQSQLGTIELAIDGQEVKVFEQPCEMGACAMTRTFDYVVDENPDGPQEVSVTATDIAGNETVESFVVNNPQPPAPSCGPAAVAQPGGLPAITPPAVAEQLLRATLPQAFERSSLVELAGFQIQPALDGSDTEAFQATGTVVESSFDRDAADGVTTAVHTDAEPNCMTPRTVSPNPSEPVPIDETAGQDATAVLYANTAQATDTVVRATETGALNLTHLRNLTTPSEFSWNVALQPGQRLSKLAGGAVAVVEPAEEGTEAPGTLEDLPAQPTVAQRRQAIDDTELQLRQASDALERAQGDNPDRVLGLIPPAWAQDNLGNPCRDFARCDGFQGHDERCPNPHHDLSRCRWQRVRQPRWCR